MWYLFCLSSSIGSVIHLLSAAIVRVIKNKTCLVSSCRCVRVCWYKMELYVSSELLLVWACIGACVTSAGQHMLVKNGGWGGVCRFFFLHDSCLCKAENSKIDVREGSKTYVWKCCILWWAPASEAVILKHVQMLNCESEFACICANKYSSVFVSDS